jgi:hypothetical protein
MQDYQAADTKQRAQWTRFVNGLNHLNRLFAKTRADIYWLQKAIEFYRSKHESFPPSFGEENVPALQSAATRWMQGVTTLNNAFALSQSGSAIIAPSKMYPGDLDLLVEENAVPEAVRNNATFVKSSIPDAELGAIIPLIIVGGIIVGSLIIVSGIVDSITETTTKHKRLDNQMQRIKAKVEKDILGSTPDVAKAWLSYKKKEVEPVEKGFLATAGEAAGGIVGIAVIGLVLFMIWKNYGGKK